MFIPYVLHPVHGHGSRELGICVTQEGNCHGHNCPTDTQLVTRVALNLPQRYPTLRRLRRLILPFPGRQSHTTQSIFINPPWGIPWAEQAITGSQGFRQRVINDPQAKMNHSS